MPEDQDGTPSWSCSQAVSKPVWHTPLLCVQWKTADDGQRNCPKHVEFYSRNKFEKLVHLVGFIIRTQKPSCNDVLHNWCFPPNHIRTMPHSINKMPPISKSYEYNVKCSNNLTNMFIPLSTTQVKTVQEKHIEECFCWSVAVLYET